MAYTPELIAELEILALYNLDNHQEGLKVHNNASNRAQLAITRLHEKGLVTQADGGYLTSLGLDAAEHAQALLTILRTKPARAGPSGAERPRIFPCSGGQVPPIHWAEMAARCPTALVVLLPPPLRAVHDAHPGNPPGYQ